jgi:curli biogenesis system outer membrane secretion channel CsgG
MKKISHFFIHLGLIIALAGCASISKDKSRSQINLPSYSGPKASIVVADFEVNAAKADKEIGVGLREMLLALLSNSNRFTIVGPKDSQAAQKEAGEKQNTQTKPADLAITVKVTEFEPHASGGKAGLGGGGGVDSGLMGGLLGNGLNRAYMSLDISIVDTFTAAVLAVSGIQGQAQDTSGNNTTGKDSRSLGTELSAYAHTPMEKAMRECIMEAMRYISQTIPPDYYKY